MTNAKQAVQLASGEWQLSDLTKTSFNPASLETEIAAAETRNNLVNAELLQGLSVPVESMSIGNLLAQITYLRRNQLDSNPIELALWTKITNPLSTLVMLMLSLSLIHI